MINELNSIKTIRFVWLYFFIIWEQITFDFYNLFTKSIDLFIRFLWISHILSIFCLPFSLVLLIIFEFITSFNSLLIKIQIIFSLVIVLSDFLFVFKCFQMLKDFLWKSKLIFPLKAFSIYWCFSENNRNGTWVKSSPLFDKIHWK